jgi:release factor glutamine methyltransferase
MKAAIKNIVAITYKPFMEKYLSQKRTYTYGNIKLQIPPEVFHPGFFTSTQFLLQYIKKLTLWGKLLELGLAAGLFQFMQQNKMQKLQLLI